MLSYRHYWVFLLGLFGLFACGNNNQSSEDMSQFAEDTAFQAAHPSPDSLAFTGRGEMVDIPTTDGQAGRAYVLRPDQPSDKYLLVFHEWWGLNDHIKRESERLFDSLQNVTVMALDLYDGQVATTPDDAGRIMGTIKEERARAIIQGALQQIGADGDVGTIGWCFGGGWSLQASIMAGNRGEACVMYYGMPVQNAAQLQPLEAPVLGIFAGEDDWITPKVVTDFKQLADATDTELEVVSYPAAHAFANPSNPDYDAEAAQKANSLALAFLREHL